MPAFNKVLNLFVDWHRTEGRHRRSVNKIKQSSQPAEPQSRPQFTKPNLERTEQLSLPKPRKLLATKLEFGDILNETRKENLDHYLEKSLQTIYARLMEDKLKQDEKDKLLQTHGKLQQNKMSKADYEQWLLNIAKPKRIFTPDEKVFDTTENAVSKATLKYNPSEHTQKLATPRRLRRKFALSQQKRNKSDLGEAEDGYSYPGISVGVSKAALKYNASELIKKLATPRRLRQKFPLPQQKRNQFGLNADEDEYSYPRVSPNALKYKVTGYTLKLSRPKGYGLDKEKDPIAINDKAQRKLRDRYYYEPVNRNALKYELSAKIRQLAKAKEYEEIKENSFAVKKNALRVPDKKKLKIYENLAAHLERKHTPKFEIPKHTS